jgi:hypothetical protein
MAARTSSNRKHADVRLCDKALLSETILSRATRPFAFSPAAPVVVEGSVLDLFGDMLSAEPIEVGDRALGRGSVNRVKHVFCLDKVDQADEAIRSDARILGLSNP